MKCPWYLWLVRSQNREILIPLYNFLNYSDPYKTWCLKFYENLKICLGNIYSRLKSIRFFIANIPPMLFLCFSWDRDLSPYDRDLKIESSKSCSNGPCFIFTHAYLLRLVIVNYCLPTKQPRSHYFDQILSLIHDLSSRCHRANKAPVNETSYIIDCCSPTRNRLRNSFTVISILLTYSITHNNNNKNNNC